MRHMTLHPLEIWLDKANESKSEFAARAGISRMAVWRVINGGQISIEMLRVISAATGGEVQMADLLPRETAA